MGVSVGGSCAAGCMMGLGDGSREALEDVVALRELVLRVKGLDVRGISDRDRIWQED